MLVCDLYIKLLKKRVKCAFFAFYMYFFRILFVYVEKLKYFYRRIQI